MSSLTRIGGQHKGTFFAVVIGLITAAVFLPMLWPDALAVSALRSRSYGFRNTDNKAAIEMIQNLGMKVKVDTHSSTVIVLTSEDDEELAKAYTLVEINDRKEPVAVKRLGHVSEQDGKGILDALHKQLKELLPATLLDPPAGNVSKALIVDVYKGELIVIAQAAEIQKVQTAWQAYQQKAQAAAKPVNEAAADPNKPSESKVQAEIKSETKPAQAEPAPSAEPNQTRAEQPKNSEEFISNELLKSLTAAEKKEPNKIVSAAAEPNKVQLPMESKKAAETSKPEAVKTIESVAKTEEAKPADANGVAPANKKKGSEMKAVLEQLKKQAEQRKEKAAKLKAEFEKQEMSSKMPAEGDVKPETAGIPSEKATPESETSRPAETDNATQPADAKIKAVPAESVLSRDEEELELTITLPEKIEVQQLIDLMCKQLGLNYVFDPAQAQTWGSVMLRINDGKIKVKDCYTLLQSVLRFRQLAMTRTGNLITVVPMAQSTQFTDPILRRENDPIEKGQAIISSIYELKYISVNNAMNILRAMNLGTQIPYIPVVETNTLIVTDYSHRMPKVEEVIRIIDVPGVPKKYTYRQLEYMPAADLLPRLQKLASQLQNITITVGASGTPAGISQPTPRVVPGQPVPQPMPQPSMPTSIPQDQATTVYLDADERTNRVLMIGNEEQLQIVNNLIDSLDVKQYKLQYVKEYEIKNVDASEVINVLNELGLASVSETKGTTGSSSPIQRPIVPGQPQQPQPMMQPQQRVGAAAAGGGIDQPFISIRPNTNSLLVNATGEQHERIELVIKYIDVTQKDQRTIKEYEIQNIDAQEVVQTLGDLGVISSQSVSSITSSKDSMYSGYGSSRSGSQYGSQYGMQNRAMPGMVQPGMVQPGMESQATNLITMEGTEKDLTATEPKISILENTNSLLVHATPRQHDSISLVIAYVDRQLTADSTPYVVYPLENQKPEDLATTLEDLIQSKERTARTATKSATPNDPRLVTQSNPQQASPSGPPILMGEQIKIIPDKSSNSIIVYANKKNQQWISELIKELDQYRPQVLLDCTLVEITKNDQFTFDLDMVAKQGGFPAGGSMTQLPAIVDPFPNSEGSLIESTVTNGSGSAFYADSHIQALLNLIDKNNYGRVLAKPSLLVKDNEEGIIKTEKTIYVAQQKTNIQPQGQGTDAIQTTDVSFKDYKSDITLTITPHISSEKVLSLEIVLNRTDFDTSSGDKVQLPGSAIPVPKPYDQITSNIDTWSVIPDGATIILGGIEQVNQGKTHTKVPILGDIPLVGLLFRGIDQTDKQSRLYVFVKANILKPSDELTGKSDIERVSQKKRKTFENFESKFQELEAIPGLKPNPINPEKVLEDDEYIERLNKQPESGTPTVTVEIP